ncbi:SPFH domain-containing protein, partial [Streptomyces diastatochromogenes]
MSTTTSHTSESEEQPESAVGAGGTATRPARLIQNEATTEIPVHLLFRDEPDPESVPVPLKPAVVGRRPGPGAQPPHPRAGPAPPPPRPP